jgi:hypothetical protein
VDSKKEFTPLHVAKGVDSKKEFTPFAILELIGRESNIEGSGESISPE